MKIRSFKIENYKSFRETDTIQLSDGFNIVVAPNNVGKTALLEVLSTRFTSKPHRALSFPPSHPLNTISRVEVEFFISGEELKNILFQGDQFYWPVRDNDMNNSDKVYNDINNTFSSGGITMLCNIDNNQIIRLISLMTPTFEVEDKPNIYSHAWNVNREKTDITFAAQRRSNLQSMFPTIVAKYCSDNIYTFRAERLNLGRCGVGNNSVLAPDASNLAEVLTILQSNHYRLQELNSHLSEIFSNIFQVTTRPAATGGGQFEIIVWTVDPRLKRDDLAIELEESGTGIGQVLAMLYVAITSTDPRIILIDEPNTFLHPAAARKLVEILKLYPHHQYIFATHSPEIIRISDPGTLISIRWENNESKLIPIDGQNIEDLRAVLLDVGAKLSDVFGADAIIWVEGLTEEECFPRILREVRQRPLLGVSILAVRSTGDFESKRANADLIWEIYEKLTSGRALLPPAIAFVFDREGRSEQEIQDLFRRSDGRVQFLPRRTFENYLIHPGAIAALMNSLETFSEQPVTEKAVHDWLVANAGKKKYCQRLIKIKNLDDPNWLIEMHGAKLLADLFRELSEQKEEYRKRSHSVWLTDWLLENDPGAFLGLAEFLIGLLPEA